MGLILFANTGLEDEIAVTLRTVEEVMEMTKTANINITESVELCLGIIYEDTVNLIGQFIAEMNRRDNGIHQRCLRRWGAVETVLWLVSGRN